jgi:hypothetical protein
MIHFLVDAKPNLVRNGAVKENGHSYNHFGIASDFAQNHPRNLASFLSSARAKNKKKNDNKACDRLAELVKSLLEGDYALRLVSKGIDNPTIRKNEFPVSGSGSGSGSEKNKAPLSSRSRKTVLASKDKVCGAAGHRGFLIPECRFIESDKDLSDGEKADSNTRPMVCFHPRSCSAGEYVIDCLSEQFQKMKSDMKTKQYGKSDDELHEKLKHCIQSHFLTVWTGALNEFAKRSYVGELDQRWDSRVDFFEKQLDDSFVARYFKYNKPKIFADYYRRVSAGRNDELANKSEDL